MRNTNKSFIEYQLKAIDHKLFDIQQHFKVISDDIQAIQVFVNNIKGELQ